jgi:RNA polymerase sigma factor (sigma-70 family)
MRSEGKARRMMTADLLSRVRAGDGEAFRELTGPHRRELQVHCYRMLGSILDAEDAVQETMLAAWRGIGGFAEERASPRTWLYKIATNRCLNARRATSRRPAREWDVSSSSRPYRPRATRPSVLGATPPRLPRCVRILGRCGCCRSGTSAVLTLGIRAPSSGAANLGYVTTAGLSSSLASPARTGCSRLAPWERSCPNWAAL